MLAGPLPELLDHRRLANQQGVIEGSFPVKQLERFGEMLVDQAGDVNLKLEFSKGERDRTEVTGHLTAEVRLECQLCLQPVTLMLSSVFSVVVVKNEAELEHLEEEQDGVVHADKLIPVAALVEDELMLAVPMIPRHPDGECPDSDYAVTEDLAADEKDEPATTYRPFAGLADAIDKQNEPES
ncbi:MAG: DUF177 domain-containing protein [Pseudomonadales bacterium]|nr:DUF177 domain-containing protein [Pseudomonadales bacterium]MBO6564498.1 DUF177 domain-containing protein [Pseudomonadales bacterium]MBO6595377.1 DUF177 domain-containing protein [Pseudomonadales bacterium]MBO6701878.1 DUF177 domain-containing protein [Pseudomonadales bacterium]MBO6821064.1 DUF177 domain-containing protein [Pseudomonadales bacterium]